MSLLPYKYSVKDQAFASLLMDEKAMCTYTEIDTNPMTCKSSLLAHLAKGENLNIDGMLESEARFYIANARDLYNTKGTLESAYGLLGIIGLHTPEFPAEIIEYRQMSERTYKEWHNGASSHDGTSKHNGGLPTDSFSLTKWYQIAVIISVKASPRQIDLAYKMLKNVIPTRCEIVGFIAKIKDLHDGATLQDGSRTHGQWRFE